MEYHLRLVKPKSVTVSEVSQTTGSLLFKTYWQKRYDSVLLNLNFNFKEHCLTSKTQLKSYTTFTLYYQSCHTLPGEYFSGYLTFLHIKILKHATQQSTNNSSILLTILVLVYYISYYRSHFIPYTVLNTTTRFSLLQKCLHNILLQRVLVYLSYLLETNTFPK